RASVHTIVHPHPQNTPTRRPVSRWNADSKTAATPMRAKNPPVVRHSILRPTPHMPRSCKTPDTANAPMHAQGFPSSAPPRRARRTTNKSRKNWYQRKLQNSMNDVDVHGRSESGGHAHSGSRRRMRPISREVVNFIDGLVHHHAATEADRAAKAEHGTRFRVGRRARRLRVRSWRG
ncbi:hypothetical protein BJV78DRAFT_1194155, partial [Lactifluus subvellereus]